MSEMVDRAALAAKRVLNGNAPDDFKGVLTDETLREIARAVIAVVREPTEPMLAKFCCYEEGREEILGFWQDAIDEALK